MADDGLFGWDLGGKLFKFTLEKGHYQVVVITCLKCAFCTDRATYFQVEAVTRKHRPYNLGYGMRICNSAKANAVGK